MLKLRLLGLPGGEEERKKQQSRIHRLLLGLGATEEELAAERKAAEAEEPAAPPLPPPAEDPAAANGDAAPEPNGDVTANGIHEAAAHDSPGARPEACVCHKNLPVPLLDGCAGATGSTVRSQLAC